MDIEGVIMYRTYINDSDNHLHLPESKSVVYMKKEIEIIYRVSLLYHKPR